MSEESAQENAPQDPQEPSGGEPVSGPGTAQEPVGEEQNSDEPSVYDLSSQAASLAEREASLNQMSTELETKLQRVSAMEEAMANAKQDPMALLNSMGVEYGEVTDKYLDTLGDRTKTESEVILDKINMLESQVSTQQQVSQERADALHRESQKQQYNGAMQQVNAFLGENTEKYELVSKMQSADLVLNVIGEHYSNTKEILDMDKACQAVEEYYEEEAKRYLASDKLLDKLGLAKTETLEGTRDNRPRTLTNNIGTKAPRYKDDRPVSRQESLDRAASMLRWD